MIPVLISFSSNRIYAFITSLTSVKSRIALKSPTLRIGEESSFSIFAICDAKSLITIPAPVPDQND